MNKKDKQRYATLINDIVSSPNKFTKKQGTYYRMCIPMEDVIDALNKFAKAVSKKEFK